MSLLGGPIEESELYFGCIVNSFHRPCIDRDQHEGNMDVGAFLGQIDLLKGLPEEQLETLAEHARIKDYAPGDMIIAEKDASRGLYILMEGRAKLYRSTPDGREQTIYIFTAGEPFCLCSVFAEKREPATAEALEPCRVLIISDKDFTEMAEKEPAVLFGMLLIMSRRLKEAMDMIESLSIREIPVRLANFLVYAMDDDGCYTLPMTHRELAKIIGATPEALSRAFKRLSEYGLASLDGRKVSIHDKKGIMALAGIRKL